MTLPVSEMTAWRRHLHAHPETAFEETATAEFVAARLRSFGLEVHRGLAGTGVVATLRGRQDGPRRIALRADMDGLHLREANDFAHRSRHEGRMHGCGHDGHMAMLLGAAQHLAATRNFRGTVDFIFQPAEENEGGGRRMVEEGLFDLFPAEMVFGMHNWPGLAAGTLAVRAGPLLAAFDIFEIVINGNGAHGAMPHQGIDPVPIAAAFVQAAQTIVSRTLSPLDQAVVSITQIHGGDAYNVIPDSVVLRGTTRSFRPAVQDRIEAVLRRIAEQSCAAHGATASVRYERRYPPTINAPAPADAAHRAAIAVAGPGGVIVDVEPSMAAEDFAFMLQARPGCFVLIGNGEGCALHNPRYDFNDGILDRGRSFWVKLVEQELC